MKYYKIMKMVRQFFLSGAWGTGSKNESREGWSTRVFEPVNKYSVQYIIKINIRVMRSSKSTMNLISCVLSQYANVTIYFNIKTQ